MENDSLHPEGEEKQEPFQVRLVWGAPDELVTIYTNQLSISYTGNEYYLLFGELYMPAILDANSIPDELKIIPKVRLAISPGAMSNIAQVIFGYVKKTQGA